MPANSRAWAASPEVGQPQRVGDEGQPGPLLLVLGDQPQQDAVLEGAAQEEVADDGLVLLAVAVDAAIALFQPVRVERQFHVDQLVAALVQVETLGSRIGADQDQALLLAEPLGDGLPDLVVVVAATWSGWCRCRARP